jgi:hypothetical protein
MNKRSTRRSTRTVSPTRRDRTARLARAVRPVVCEALEARRLLWGGDDPSEQVYNVHGTAGSDTIAVTVHMWNDTREFSVTVNGQTKTFTHLFIYDVNILGGGGDDKITVTHDCVGTQVHAYGEAGNDTLTFRGPLDTWDDAIGGAGTDKLVVDRSTGPAGDEYVLDGFRVTMDSYYHSGRVDLSGVEDLTFLGGSGYDHFVVKNTPAGRKTTIRGGGANDTVYIGDGDVEDQIKGKLTVLGEGGDNDVVIVNDETDTGNDTYQLLATMFTKPGTMSESVSLSAEYVEVQGNAGNNTFKLLSTTARKVALEGAAGNDTFEIGNGDLDNFTKFLTVYVNGGSDWSSSPSPDPYTDTVVYKDQYDTGGKEYAYNDDWVWRDDARVGVEFFAGVDRVKILAGSGSNVVAPYTTQGLTAAIAAYVDAGAGNDSVTGTDANDTFVGGAGDDTLVGLGGNDVLDGGSHGADKFVGGAGHDTVTYESRTDGLRIDLNTAGGDGAVGENDSVGADVEVIKTCSGWDVVTTKAGTPTTVFSGGGNDTLTGSSANDYLDGGTGTDSVVGNGGNDFLFLRGSAGSVAKGGDGNDQVFAYTTDGVRIEGGVGNDFLNGGGGNDTIVAGSGKDIAFGGLGNDSIEGGSGDDLLEGNGGHDTLKGGADDDWLNGQAGSDVLLGGTGDDVLNAKDGYGVDQLDGGDGDDELLRETYDTVLGW